MTNVWNPILSIFILSLVQISLVTAKSAPSISSYTEDRIITVFDDVLNGVPVDFRYNESRKSLGLPSISQLPSVPGCPKSDEGYPWVYYGFPPKCYLAGQRGPCKLEQRIFIKEGTPYGFCNCDCFEGITISNQVEAQFCKQVISGSQEWVYLAALEECFTLYEQGPCGNNQWIVKVKGNGSNNTTSTKAKCENITCPIGEIPLKFERDGEQTCGSHYARFSLSAGISTKNCQESGMRYSKLLKQCVAKITIKF